MNKSDNEKLNNCVVGSAIGTALVVLVIALILPAEATLFIGAISFLVGVIGGLSN